LNDAGSFLLQHRYSVLFAVVLMEQLGLPMPAVPFLLAAGALAGMGELVFGRALGLAVLASLLSDLTWYQAGRLRGRSILTLLCRISLEPDSCVRRTENTFARRGPRTLLVAKFVPGLNTVATPLAGIVGMRPLPFLAYAAGGGLLWAGSYLLLGYVFRSQIDALLQLAVELGGRLAVILLGLFAAWLLWKWRQRRRFLHDLRVARIEPAELQRKMEAGEDLVIVDLRSSLDFEADPRTIPGALRMASEDLDARHADIPRGREVVLYCT
jgi:membrane protein DedA with SNARE-associated domain